MIGKTKVGKSFKGCINYNLCKVESGMGEILECRGVREERTQMIRDFNQGRFANSKLGRPVWHTSLSFQEKLTNEEMLMIAKDWMSEMNLDETQYVILTHLDTNHPHVHIVANRISDSGKTISDSNNWKRSESACTKLIEKYSLTPVPNIRNENLINREKLKGRDLVKSDVNRAIEKVLPQTKSLTDFTKMLKKSGIKCEVVFDEDEVFMGLIFKKGDIRIKASDLNIQSSKLIATLLKLEPKQQSLKQFKSRDFGLSY